MHKVEFENITLWHADCLEVLPLLSCVDAVISDPPYGMTACAWDSVIPFALLWEQYLNVTKETAPIILTATQPFTSLLITSNIGMFKYSWVWVKNTPTGIAQAKYAPMRYNEDICIFYRALPTYNPQRIERTPGSSKRCQPPVKNGGNGDHISLLRRHTQYDPESKNPSNVIYFDTPPNSKGKLHPTQKPVELMEYLIATYSNEGDKILDNCMGSGTTGIACIRSGRKFIGIEKDAGHFDTACRRIEQELGQLQLAL
jgi:site-specific DNA-methyltransferase (adenine-specific)